MLHLHHDWQGIDAASQHRKVCLHRIYPAIVLPHPSQPPGQHGPVLITDMVCLNIYRISDYRNRDQQGEHYRVF